MRRLPLILVGLVSGAITWAAGEELSHLIGTTEIDSLGATVDVVLFARLVTTVAVIALAGWVALSTALVLAISVRRLPHAEAIAFRISPRPLQRWTHSLVGLSLTAGLAAPAPGAGSLAEPPPLVEVTTTAPELSIDVSPGTATMRPLGEVSSSDEASTSVTSPSSVPELSVTTTTTTSEEAVSTTSEPPPNATSTTSTTASPRPPVVVTDAAPRDPVDRDRPSLSPVDEAGTGLSANEVVVEAGDSFWSIASAELPDAGEREVASYWRRLVDANRGRLVDPGNPDLIYPGQVVVLPE